MDLSSQNAIFCYSGNPSASCYDMSVFCLLLVAIISIYYIDDLPLEIKVKFNAIFWETVSYIECMIYRITLLIMSFASSFIVSNN